MKFNTLIEQITLNKKYHIFILLMFIIGVFLFSCSSDRSESSKTVESEFVTNSYSTDIENRLENILGKIDGVGKINVLVNCSTKETSYSGMFDIEKHEDELINVVGVIVVAEGVDDSSVTYILKSCISTFLNIPLHKISVFKMV